MRQKQVKRRTGEIVQRWNRDRWESTEVFTCRCGVYSSICKVKKHFHEDRQVHQWHFTQIVIQKRQMTFNPTAGVDVSLNQHDEQREQKNNVPATKTQHSVWLPEAKKAFKPHFGAKSETFKSGMNLFKFHINVTSEI